MPRLWLSELTDAFRDREAHETRVVVSVAIPPAGYPG